MLVKTLISTTQSYFWIVCGTQVNTKVRWSRASNSNCTSCVGAGYARTMTGGQGRHKDMPTGTHMQVLMHTNMLQTLQTG